MPVTPYRRHRDKWSTCTRCLLHDQRRKVVLARGRLPADIALIGEAPGASEDLLGKPFVGPAGKLLDRIIANAGWDKEEVRYILSNLVACFPKENKLAGDNEPPDEAIRACKPRLLEFLRMARPHIIVCVGALATKHLPKLLAGPKRPWPKHDLVHIPHPAALLRMHPIQLELVAQELALKLAQLPNKL